MRHAITSALFLLVSILWLALWQVWALDLDSILEKYAAPPAETEVPADTVPAVPSLEQQADRFTYEITVIREHNRLYATLAVIAAGLISLITVLFVITRRANCSANHTISAAGLTLIIFGTDRWRDHRPFTIPTDRNAVEAARSDRLLLVPR